MPANTEILVRILQAQGTMGRKAILETTGWNAAELTAAETELKAQGRLIVGRGRGGSLKLAEPEGQEPALATEPEAMTVETDTVKPKTKGRKAKGTKPEANEPIEKQLWKAADKLRKNIDAAEYKHIVLGLVFLKYIGDSFEEAHKQLLAGEGELAGADPEDPDEYRALNAFYVPPIARWDYIKANARKKDILLENGQTVNIGGLLDEAMTAIERQNTILADVLPKGYAKPNVDPATIAGLIDEIAKADLRSHDAKGRDLLGRVYEYFLGQFASAEGKKGGQFYTPESIVRLLVEMLEPYDGRVFDPCCGSGGMFVQSAKFVRAHADHYHEQGKANGADLVRHISVFGQESNQTTWRLCKMNLAIRGIDASNIKWNSEGSFLKDAHPGLKADYILANPPFNDSDWSGDLLLDDPRWTLGTPPPGNANFGWVQHFLYHLAPGGVAGFVLSNGSLSSNQSGEGEIRRTIIEADLVDCIVMLPKQLFFNTGIPACLWFLRRDRTKRQGETLFIDASELGYMEERTQRLLSDADIARIAGTYHQWRVGEGYVDEKGFCKSATLEEIAKHKYVLTPGRYVGIPDEVDDGIPFEEKLRSITDGLRQQMADGERLAREIKQQLNKIGIAI